jgi:hypothetical protein
LTIVTPCFRQENLDIVFKSINFDITKQWIIVYDPTKPSIVKPHFNHPQISEFHMEYSEPWSWCGNSQRDFAINKINSGWIYFLDDDNVMHKKFWKLFLTISLPHFYTFDMQCKYEEILFSKGGNISHGHIDTAMFLVHKEHIRDIKWSEAQNERGGDFKFIKNINDTNPEMHVYIPQEACYHNFIDNNPNYNCIFLISQKEESLKRDDDGWIKLADENSPCSAPPGAWVRYGTGIWWVVRKVTDSSFSASNDYFELDPAPGCGKRVELFSPSPIDHGDELPKKAEEYRERDIVVDLERQSVNEGLLVIDFEKHCVV